MHTCVAASFTQLPELLSEVLKRVQYGISGGPAVTIYRVFFTVLNHHHSLVGREINRCCYLWLHLSMRMLFVTAVCAM